MKICIGNISKFSLDPDCYKLVNRSHVSRDLEYGDPEFGYDKT